MEQKQIDQLKEKSLERYRKVAERIEVGTSAQYRAPDNDHDFEVDEHGYVDGVVKDVKYNEFCCDVRMDFNGSEFWVDGEDVV